MELICWRCRSFVGEALVDALSTLSLDEISIISQYGVFHLGARVLLKSKVCMGVVVAREARYVGSFGSKGKGEGQFDCPKFVAVITTAPRVRCLDRSCFCGRLRA